MLRSAAALLAACLPLTVAAQDFNEAPPIAAGQQPAFPGQTRAPVLADDIPLKTTVMAEGLEHPWGMAELPDGSWLITERPGRLRLLGADGVLSDPIAGLPAVDNRGQGGLLDVTVADDFDQTRRIWFSFSEPRAKWKSLIRGRNDSANRTAVGTGTLSADGTMIEGTETIFRQQPAWHAYGHFGSRLVLDGQGGLFVTTGDREEPESRQMAQDPETQIGKVMRIDLDGGQPELWSMGHRNVQAAALDDTGALWTVEHGPQGGDELNRPKEGANYGWPVIFYGQEYDGEVVAEGKTAQDGMEQPIYYWDPAIAPSGLAFYQGTMFPEWQGDALIGGMGALALVRLELDGEKVTGEARHLIDIGRIRDVEVASDGAIVLLIDDPDAPMIRVTRGE